MKRSAEAIMKQKRTMWLKKTQHLADAAVNQRLNEAALEQHKALDGVLEPRHDRVMLARELISLIKLIV